MRSDRHRALLVLAFAAAALMAPNSASAVCVLTCPEDIRANVADVEGTVQENYTVFGTPDCMGIEQTSGLPPGGFFPVGTTTNSFRGTADLNATCQFDVTVVYVGSPGVPALGVLGLGVLTALLGGLGLRTARRRPRRTA